MKSPPNLPAWWNKEIWRKKIKEDPRQRSILLSKILELAIHHVVDEWDLSKIGIQRGIEYRKAKMTTVGSILKKEMKKFK